MFIFIIRWLICSTKGILRKSGTKMKPTSNQSQVRIIKQFSKDKKFILNHWNLCKIFQFSIWMNKWKWFFSISNILRGFHRISKLQTRPKLNSTQSDDSSRVKRILSTAIVAKTKAKRPRNAEEVIFDKLIFSIFKCSQTLLLILIRNSTLGAWWVLFF